MKLTDTPPQQPSSPPHSPTQRPSSSTQPPVNDPPPTQPSQSYTDAFYNSLSVELASIHVQQQVLQDTQTQMLQNQSLLMTRFENMQLQMDSFASTQTEILNLLKSHFPPPPPPGSEL